MTLAAAILALAVALPSPVAAGPVPPMGPAAAAPHVPALVGLASSATWYCLPGVSRCTRGYPSSCACAAAGSVLRHRFGRTWRGTWIVVKYRDRSIRVRLVDANMGSSLDLYASQFRKLAPLARGRLAVTVRRAPDVHPAAVRP